MRRREFIPLLGSALLASPLRAGAQSARMPTVALLALGNPNPDRFLRSVTESLRTLGYRDGQSMRLEFRSAGGQASALPDAAAELVRRKVDVIVAW
jgi:putative ABC transport system substrate-binding protein